MDQEVLQDFLDEAGELVDRLAPQLMVLEDEPEDLELVNGVFRIFHTIKGTAGFLSLESMAELCHRAEDVLARVRQGNLAASPRLVDVMLEAADVLGAMFISLGEGKAPSPAAPSLLDALEELMHASPAAGASRAQDAGVTSAEALDDDLEALLDSMHRGSAASPKMESAELEPDRGSPATITEDSGCLDRTVLLNRTSDSRSSPLESSCDHPREDHATRPSKSVRPPVTPPVTLGGDASVRVAVTRLDDMMNLVGELGQVRNRLTTLVESGASPADMSATVGSLDVVTRNLQTSVIRARMQSVRRVFSRFPRVVRKLARSLGKNINLVLRGEEIEIDRNLIEQLSEPLVHLVRNAVDHGIETPEERAAAGKPGTGEVSLEASHEGHSVVFTIRDDGRGIDTEKLRAIAVDRDLLAAEAASALSDTEALELIFAAGFSTRYQVSDISGRGVGMNVVRTRIAELRGTVDIESSPNAGTCIRIVLPLAQPIFRSLMVWVDGQHFALPLVEILEIISAEELAVQWLDGRQFVLVSGEPALLVPLGCLFASRARPAPGSDTLPEGTHAVVVTLGSRRVAMLVDGLIGQEEIVVKPLTGALRTLAPLAGATITGDGDIALIVDIGGAAQAFDQAA